MQLYVTSTSPYVRKVLISAIETGHDKHIEKITTQVWSPDTTIAATNPLGKIPVLISDDGMILYDSLVICEYLDSLNPRPQLFPASGPFRWNTLRLHALTDGINDATVSLVLETRRPPEKHHQPWIQRQKNAIVRSLNTLETYVDTFKASLTIGTINTLVALGYLDLRLPELEWRKICPRVALWFETESFRPSFQATRPDVS